MCFLDSAEINVGRKFDVLFQSISDRFCKVFNNKLPFFCRSHWTGGYDYYTKYMPFLTLACFLRNCFVRTSC